MLRTVLLSSLALLTVFPLVAPRAQAVEDGDKVLVVMVYDGTCHAWCDEVRPIISGVTRDYGKKVVLREIDVQKSALKNSLSESEQLGVKSFVEGSMAWVPTVGVFTTKRKLVKSITGVGKAQSYKKSIDKALKASS